MNTKFENLAENPLDGVMVSISRKIKYADINIERMEKNNPDGVLTHLIEDTKQKRDAYTGNLSTSKMNEAIRIAYTSELAEITDEFRRTVSKFEGLVKSVFDKKSLVYLMFYPHGIEEYHKSNQAQIPILMDKIIDLNQTYASQLGTMVYHDLFHDQKNRYTNAYSLQKQAGGTVINTSTVKEILWKELKKQLYKNMLTIVLYNIDNPKLMLSYFEPSLLRFRHHKTDDTTNATYKLQIPALSSKAAEISFSVDDTLLIINNGAKSIFYCGAATAEGDQSKPTLIEIPVGEEAEVTAVSLGAPANKFIIFVNKDASEEAEVEIALI
ncbi:MAG: hypothetical protein HXX18_04440 [Bacteroidetes bacterium]|nr:hypothetical protein [Bacteroidota bacterium]